MHAKTDSDLTSLANSTPPRSPRRPVYYVMSPSNMEGEKLSFGGMSPAISPPHHHHHQHYHHHQHPTHHRYASSPIHHSRESSATRFSASMKNGYWRKMTHREMHAGDDDDDDKDGGDGEEDEYGEDEGWGLRCYGVMFVAGFVFLFSLFSVILWGASKAYQPKISVKSVVFERYNIQAGVDFTGVPTKLISVNSTVKFKFRNPANFFGVHVSSTPFQLYYYDLLIASGHMKEFYAPQKYEQIVAIAVHGKEVPVYGGGASLTSRNNGGPPAVIPFKLTFVVRARADVLGLLVRSRFHRTVRCSVHLSELLLGRPADLRRACEYD